MCMITLYKGSMEEENKIADNITRYTLDLDKKKIKVYPMLNEPQEFTIEKGLTWDESNDSMIIE